MSASASASVQIAAAGPERLERLVAAVEAVVSTRIDELSDADIRSELETAEIARRRLETRACRLAATLSRRGSKRASRANPRDPRAGERAADDVRRDLARRLNWSPGETKKAVQDGKRLESVPTAGEAADRGQLSARHARLLAETLAHLRPGPERDRLEEELTEAATGEDAVAFGRRCRRRLAEIDHDAAMRDQAARQSSRRASISSTPDGMTALSGAWTGLDAEIIATAVHAFRRPDVPGEHRRPEQRTADAVVEAMAAALRAGEAPTGHGVRPHVVVTVDGSTVASGRGVADSRWTGPIAYGEVRRLLDDAGISWLAVDGDGLPLEAGPETRTVPAGLWRALVLRDGGCIAETCDVPAQWCDVMHLGEPYAKGGRLTMATAGLGCRKHHRRFDAGALAVTWADARPTLHRPARLCPTCRRDPGRCPCRDGPGP